MAETVLIATDGSPDAEAAVSAATAVLDLGACHVIVTSVVEESDPTLITGAGFAGPVISQEEYEAEREDLISAAESAMQSAAAALIDAAESVTTRQVWGDPGPALVALADEVGAGLLVVGTRGRSGIVRAVLGSVADHLIRRAPCPVLVGGTARTAGGSGPVLAAVDDSEHAPDVIAAAVHWLGARHAVTAVTVVDEVEELVPFEGSAAHHSLLPAEERTDIAASRAQAAAARLRAMVAAADAAPAVAGPVLVGDTVPALLDAAAHQDAAALALGTRGRGGVGRALLGSVADRVVRESTRPVLVVRTRGRSG